MRRDPTIYAGLMEHALREPLPAWTEAIQRIASGYALSVTEFGIDQLRKAYVAGVADGFAQGVAAESERQDAERRGSA